MSEESTNRGAEVECVEEVRLSRRELDLLHGALGLRYSPVPYRNFLLVPPSHFDRPMVCRLIDLGLMRWSVPDVGGAEVTEAGMGWVYPVGGRWTAQRDRREAQGGAA